MDFNDIKSQVSNLTLYDLKAGFRKAQNGSSGASMPSSVLANHNPAVMNYTEMEAKVGRSRLADLGHVD